MPLACQKIKQIFSLFLFLGLSLIQPLADDQGWGDTGDTGHSILTVTWPSYES